MLTQWFTLHVDWQTPVEDVPLAIAPFQGRVLVGVGKLLRIYDLGKKKLLRKCENKVRPQYILFELSVHYILLDHKGNDSSFPSDNKTFSTPQSNYAFSLSSTFQTWWLASIPSARGWSCRTFKKACFGSVTDVTKTSSSSLPMTRILAGWPQPVCWTMTPWPRQTSLATSAL